MVKSYILMTIRETNKRNLISFLKFNVFSKYENLVYLVAFSVYMACFLKF